MHYNHPPFLLLLLLMFFSLPTQLPLAARLPDFSLDLVSPFSHNKDNSECEPFESEIEPSGKTYLMSVGLSMPSGGKTTTTLATADTGSDFIWLDGIGCKGTGCHCEGEEKKNTAQCIDMADDKYYYCNPKWCYSLQNLPGARETLPCSFEGSEKSCPYNTGYGDRFNTSGRLAKGYFKLAKNDEKKEIPIMFGVSTESNGTMDKNSAGIIGLGRGNLSLMYQLSEKCGIHLRFSYCLIHPKSTKCQHKKSKLRLGPQVTISEKFAELVTGDDKYEDCKKRYCVELGQISVNDHVQEKGTHTQNIIEVSQEVSVMVIDTGTTFTFLRGKLFNDFYEKVKQVVGKEADEHGCFESVEKLKSVSVSLTFKDGLTVELKTDNIFVLDKDGKYCLTVKKNTNEQLEEHKLNVLGSWAQTNFKVAIGVDQHGKWKASFDEEECCGGGDQEEAEALDFQE